MNIRYMYLHGKEFPHIFVEYDYTRFGQFSMLI